MKQELYADDCLNILNDELALPTESVDLIYLDPPFNSNSTYNLPFKKFRENVRAVEAFKDTWDWGETEIEIIEQLKKSPQTKILADIVSLSDQVNKSLGKISLPAYLINMALRLVQMHRVLKGTGSIYLHCDPTASHYLKLLMDAIFGAGNFRNEIIWHYPSMSRTETDFPKKHDVLFRYTKSKNFIFNHQDVLIPYAKSTLSRAKYGGAGFTRQEGEAGYLTKNGKIPDTVWDIPHIKSKKEHLGYPTQKPLALMERIIKASSNKGDLILDPFCGCGTTLHAAEKLKRQWIGIDISKFSNGLVNERLTSNFQGLNIKLYGTPTTTTEAMELAKQDKFEFEKWVCGHIGANGMYHNPGDKGADGGVDGVLEIYTINFGKNPEKETVIIQVKGGGVTPDAVGRLYSTVKEFNALAGVMICFEKYMKTVENNRNKEKFHDSVGSYPVIQGLSIEDMLKRKKPRLPASYTRKSGRIKGIK